MRPIILAIIALCSSAALLAQPVIKTGGIVNGASWSLAGELNSGIAQGSIFVIAGSGLGPAKLTPATTFPLPTTKGLGGVTVQILTPTSTYAVLLWVRDDYIAAVLPSTVPVGPQRLTVTYNGETSSPVPFNVVAGSVGLLSQSSNGTGPGLITDATKTFVNNDIRTILVNPTNSAKPGDTLILWATGVGPVSWNEATTPPASPPNLEKSVAATVYIGEQVVTPTFAGRSGCCAGLDQIQFEVPKNTVTGCQVPIAVMIGDTVSNFVSAAIDATGEACSDEFGFSAEDITTMASGSENFGFASYITQRVPGAIQTLPFTYDPELTQFVKLGATSISGVQSPRPSLYTCMVSQFVNPAYPSYIDPFTYHGTGLDAGASVFVSWPPASGVFVAQSTTNPGEYADQIADMKGGPAASYKFQGSGGKDVGHFVVTLAPGKVSSFSYTARSGPTRGANPGGMTVYWKGGDPNGFVEITAYNVLKNGIGEPGIGFICESPTSTGSFFIPKAVTDSMFAGGTTFGLTAWTAPVPLKAGRGGQGLGIVRLADSSERVCDLLRPFRIEWHGIIVPMSLDSGKIKHMKALANKAGVIAAAAMDQRGSLQKSIASAKGIDVKHVTDEMM